MMKRIFLLMLLPAMIAGACSNSPKELSYVTTGMSSQMVFDIMGMPSSKNQVGNTEVWTYPDSNRVVVFRKDSVYRIYTSPRARIDTLGTQVRNIGKSASDIVKDVAGQIDETGKDIKNQFSKDSIIK